VIDLSNIPKPYKICNHHNDECIHGISMEHQCDCCGTGVSVPGFCSCCSSSNINFDSLRKHFDEVREEEPIVKKQLTKLEKKIKEPSTLESKLNWVDNNTVIKVADKEQLEKLNTTTNLTDEEVKESENLIGFANDWKNILNKTSNQFLDSSDLLEETKLLGFDYIQMIRDPVLYLNELNVNSNGPEYFLPFVLHGTSICKSDIWNIKNVVDIPNSDIMSCGYEAYNYIFPNDLTLNEFKSIANNTENFSVSEIVQVCETREKNLILISKDYTNISKFNDSIKFGVIIHSSIIEGDNIDHYYAGSVDLISKPMIYFACGFFKNLEVRRKFLRNYGLNPEDLMINVSLDYETTLSIEMGVHKALRNFHNDNLEVKLPSLKKIGNAYYLTNNHAQKHDIKTGNIHIKVRDSAVSMLELLNLNPEEALKSTIMQSNYNRALTIADDLTQECNELLKEKLKQLMRVKSYTSKNQFEYDIKAVKEIYINGLGNRSIIPIKNVKIDLSQFKLKH